MSTGFGYDMILLSVKGPGGARVAPARSKAPRRPHHHASPPKKRRGQHRHHPSAASRSSTRAKRAVVQESTSPLALDDAATARVVRFEESAPVWSRQYRDVARYGNMPRCQDLRGVTTGHPVQH